MSTLKSARQTIEAELRHAEQGISFYQSRAEALRAALEQLSQADGGSATASRSGKRGATAAATATATGVAGSSRKTRAGGKRSQALPRMTRDFWLGFISHEPKSAIEVINMAIASFDPPLNADQSKKMKQRATQALQALLTSKQIKDVGTGRQRRYFLPLGKSTSNGKQAAKTRTTQTDSSGTILH